MTAVTERTSDVSCDYRVAIGQGRCNNCAICTRRADAARDRMRAMRRKVA